MLKIGCSNVCLYSTAQNMLNVKFALLPKERCKNSNNKSQRQAIFASNKFKKSHQ